MKVVVNEDGGIGWWVEYEILRRKYTSWVITGMGQCVAGRKRLT